VGDAAAAPVVVAPEYPLPGVAGSRWLVVANPVAGRAGPDSRAWRRLERALRQAGVGFDIEWTRGRGDGARVAADALARGQQRLLVAGGDGSLHDVVNGLLRSRGEADDAPPAMVPTVVPLPIGTGNDWARSLDLPSDPDALAATILRDEGLRHDVGRIDLLDASGAKHDTRWFINVAGTGFDAHVIERMPARTPSRLAYLFGAVRELARYRCPRFQLALVDGGLEVPPRAATLHGTKLLTFVANGRYCGGGMHVAPAARLDDGRFDVVTIDALGLLQALPKLARLYTGNLLRDQAVQHHVATAVRIDAEPAAGIEADGQFIGRTPATFSIERGALRTLRGAGRGSRR
jgi:YegS/Rv2252/BmrU family lipid kinase